MDEDTEKKFKVKGVKVKLESKVKIERVKMEEGDVKFQPPLAHSVKQEDNKSKIKIKHDPDAGTSSNAEEDLTISERIRAEEKKALKLEAELAAMRLRIADQEYEISKLNEKKLLFEEQINRNQDLLDEAFEKKNAKEEILNEMRSGSGTGPAGKPQLKALSLDQDTNAALLIEISSVKEIVAFLDKAANSALVRDVDLASQSTQTGLIESEWATLNPEPVDIRPIKK